MAASLVRRCLPNPYSVYAARNQTTAVNGTQIRSRCQFERVIKRESASDCFRGKGSYNDSSSHVRNVSSIAIGIALSVGALCIGCNKKNREKWFQAARCGDAQKVKSSTRGGNNPRTGYLGWDEYFMAVAFLSAQRSKDPRTQVGACITNQENKIVGIGYNGMPNGCKDNELPWGKSKDWLESKSPYVCHAELNAVLNKNSASVKDCKIYVALFPCNECAKVIIQSGIREVIYYSDKYSEKPKMKASRRLFDLAGVKCRQFIPRERQITIDFSSIDPEVQLD